MCKTKIKTNHWHRRVYMFSQFFLLLLLLFASYRTSGENRRKIVFTSGYIYQRKSEQNTLNEMDFLSFINKPGHSSQNMKSRHEL